jgi:hypothetical protein
MDFQKAVEEERNRLNKRLEELHTQRDALDDEVRKIGVELRAFDAFQNAKEGKGKTAKKRGPRKAGIRQSVLNIISSHPTGISRADIIKTLGDANPQAVSNALMALKKDNQVSSEKGVYSKS